jgi:PBP1b-binding outer membrane lipoprotein LpoB
MKKKLWVALILGLALLAAGCGNNPAQDTSDKQQEQQVQKEENTAVETTLGAGEWYVGEDIPAGRYIITSVKGANITVYDDEDSPSDLNEILDTNGKIGVESITYTLKDKQIIKISNGEDVLFTPKE